MNLHIHRNSFNAGEISPLMDARTDDAKHPFSCRIMENFLPKVYGGAFRRPGLVHIGTAHDLAEWTENTNDHNILFANDEAPTSSDDETFYQVGSLWLQNVRTVYKPTDVDLDDATWVQNTNTHNFYSYEKPLPTNDGTEGYDVGSVWLNQGTGAVYVCSDITTGAAVWAQATAQNNITSTAVPAAGDDSADGYTTDSYWIRNVRTLHKCTSAESSAATWDVVSGTNNLASYRIPLGADNDDVGGFSVGSHWVWQSEDRAWELTSLSASQTVRLIDLNISATVRYILELGDGYLRIWNSDGTPFLDKVNSPYNLPLQLVTPYSSSEIFDVQVAQLANLAYFAHPSYPPQKLERSFRANYFTDVFTWSQVDWSFPAFRDTNISDVTAAPSATSGSPINISFTADPFTDTTDYSRYTGARIMLSQRRAASDIELDLSATGISPDPISVLGDYQVYTYGVTDGVLLIEGKDKSGAWQTLRSFTFNSETGGRQIVFNSSTLEATDLRLNFTEGTDSAGTAYLEVGDSRRIGYARILNGIPFQDSLPVVPCAVELDFDATTATTEWAIEAWAKYAGYPRAVAFHEQRLWFGGTDLQPNTVWASRVNDFENFRRGAFDADALAFTLAAQEGSAIQSILSHESLVIFTQSEEWTLATSEQTAITPSNVFVRRQSRFGSSYRQAFVAANNLLFLQRGSRKLRQFTYSSSGAQGQASDLTRYAEHITDGGIRQMAFQQQPDPIIWAVTNNGVLLSFTFEPDENVLGWARHTSGTALFESVATIYGEDGNADEVWLTVNRGGTRAFERLDPQSYAKLEAGTVESMIYLDSSITVENDPASTAVSGLDHLEGETVSILADGAVQPPKVVSSGAITLDTAAETVIVGLPYVSMLQPSKIEVAADNGTSQGKTFVCKKVHLNLWKTYGAQFADNPNSTEWFNVQGRSTDTLLGDPEPLFTGLAEITNLGNYREGVDFTLRQTLPLPCNVLAMIPQISISKE
jgi:hypothetical protein